MAPSSFLLPFARALADAIGNHFEDNYSVRRFGPESRKGGQRGARELLRKILLKNGFVTAGSARETITCGINLVMPNLEGLEWLYARLADQESRDILVQVMAYRALGHRKVKLPLSTPAYWTTMAEIERVMDGTESIDLGFMGWRANKVDLSFLGYPVKLFCRASGVFTQFLTQQYRCETCDGIIQAETGDTVLDAGGCYGDTALYFACKTGASGRVYSFEFLPENLDVFRRNMGFNPTIAASIQLVERPLWSVSGEDLFVEGNGPGTRVTASPRNPDALRVTTLAIDDLVHDQSLTSVDLIKMDIEGAELRALKGGFQRQSVVCEAG